MMPKRDELEVRASDDVLRVRHRVRDASLAAGLSLVDQTKIVTAASELARNIVDHSHGGVVTVEVVQNGLRRGVRAIFTDSGPGIADLQQAMRDGFSTRGGLGLGLGGAKRLSNEFEIDTAPGRGTRITITRWK